MPKRAKGPPLCEQEFLQDQRKGSKRLMKIGQVDHGATKRLQAREKRKERQHLSHQEVEFSIPSEDNVSLVSLPSFSTGSQVSTSSIPLHEDNTTLEQNRYKLEKLAMTVDRFNIENYAVAQIVNAALEDMHLLRPDHFITASKVQRARKELRKSSTLSSRTELLKRIFGMYFDGRQNQQIFY